MKPTKTALALALIVAAVLASEQVLARGHGGRSGHSSGGHRGSHARSTVIIGGAVFLPPSYYYGPVAPPVVMQPEWGYIEQGSDWYYCAESQKYFPDVQECAGAWQLITPAPTPPEHRQATGTAESPVP